MIEEVGPNIETTSRYRWFFGPLDEMKYLISANKFVEGEREGEYVHWMRGINNYF